MAQGKERLRVYRQTLLGALKAAARKPTNLARVDVHQGPTGSPAAFLERLMEAFRQYTPLDLEAEGTQCFSTILTCLPLVNLSGFSYTVFIHIPRKTERGKL